MELSQKWNGGVAFCLRCRQTAVINNHWAHSFSPRALSRFRVNARAQENGLLERTAVWDGGK